MLKCNFFRSKNFNIFYDLELEKFPEKLLRVPTQPEKNRTWPEKIFISEIKFSISEVENPDFLAKKEEKTPVCGLSPLRQDKDTTFSREIQIALTSRNTLRNVKMQRFAADGVWRVVYYEAARSGEKCTALCFCKVCVQRQFSLVNCSVCVLPENRVS